MRLQRGMVVCAVAGKEKDGYYLVLKLEERFVFLVDGKHRPLEKPKRKNIKHIRPTAEVWEVDGLTNKELRRKLCEYAAKGGI
ncbi:MAG: KOW domain-containing RNA-binding protein [Oscillospiraceae bacterium]